MQATIVGLCDKARYCNGNDVDRDGEDNCSEHIARLHTCMLSIATIPITQIVSR